jgi:hypothetical protein
MKAKKKVNPWSQRKVPVHGNVEPEVYDEIMDIKTRYGLKSNTDALNLIIAEGLAVYKTKPKGSDENQVE